MNTCKSSHQFESKIVWQTHTHHTHCVRKTTLHWIIQGIRHCRHLKITGAPLNCVDGLAHSFHLSRCTTKNVIIFTCLFPFENTHRWTALNVWIHKQPKPPVFEPLECILHSILAQSFVSSFRRMPCDAPIVPQSYKIHTGTHNGALNQIVRGCIAK